MTFDVGLKILLSGADEVTRGVKFVQDSVASLQPAAEKVNRSFDELGASAKRFINVSNNLDRALAGPITNLQQLDRAFNLINDAVKRGVLTTDQASKAYSDLAKTQEKLEKESEKLAAVRAKEAKDAAEAEASTTRLAAANDYLMFALKRLIVVYGVYKLAGFVKESAELAERYEELGVAMTTVGRNAGYSKEQMLETERGMRSMGITMNESRQVILRLVAAQIDLTQATKLARVAQDAAVIGGLNSSETLERLSYAVQSGSIIMLRRIGINTSFEKSYQDMARQLGKTTEQLTEYERVQARVNAVLKEGEKITGLYEEAMTTAGKQIRSMDRYVQDFKTVFGETFNDLMYASVVVLTSNLKDANSEIRKLSEEEQLKHWGTTLTDTLAKVITFFQGIATAATIAAKVVGAFFSLAPGVVEAFGPTNLFKKLMQGEEITKGDLVRAVSLIPDFSKINLPTKQRTEAVLGELKLDVDRIVDDFMNNRMTKRLEEVRQGRSDQTQATTASRAAKIFAEYMGLPKDYSFGEVESLLQERLGAKRAAVYLQTDPTLLAFEKFLGKAPGTLDPVELEAEIQGKLGTQFRESLRKSSGATGKTTRKPKTQEQQLKEAEDILKGRLALEEITSEQYIDVMERMSQAFESNEKQRLHFAELAQRERLKLVTAGEKEKEHADRVWTERRRENENTINRYVKENFDERIDLIDRELDAKVKVVSESLTLTTAEKARAIEMFRAERRERMEIVADQMQDEVAVGRIGYEVLHNFRKKIRDEDAKLEKAAQNQRVADAVGTEKRINQLFQHSQFDIIAVFAAVKNALAGTIADVLKGAKSIGDALSNFLTRVRHSLIDEFSTVLAEAVLKPFKEVLDPLREVVSAFVSDMIREFLRLTGIQKLMQMLANWIKDALESVKPTVGDVAKSMLTSFASVTLGVTALTVAVQTLGSALGSLGGVNLSGLVNGVGGILNLLGSRSGGGGLNLLASGLNAVTSLFGGANTAMFPGFGGMEGIAGALGSVSSVLAPVGVAVGGFLLADAILGKDSGYSAENYKPGIVSSFLGGDELLWNRMSQVQKNAAVDLFQSLQTNAEYGATVSYSEEQINAKRYAAFHGILPGYQTGGEAIFTRPTIVSVAETGPEKMRVEPLAGISRSEKGLTVVFQGYNLVDNYSAKRLAREMQKMVGRRG